ncbi:MAG: V-type ATP synthase subunit F [Acidimicrobiia bacterium]|jgi:vacuolar-type H+-ATPase subunit F/Vma7
MSLSGMVFVVPSELEVGFGLAGVETVSADSEDKAADAIRDLVAGERRALVAVYEPFLSALGEQEREALESSLEPVVVPLPAGLERYDEDTHRARISAMLSRAVGYHITFGARSEQ